MSKPVPVRTFDADHYAFEVAHGDVKDAERPTTLAEHEAAERAARALLVDRLHGDRRCNDDTIPEMSDFDAVDGCMRSATDAIYEIRDWGQDIVDEASAWMRIAQDLIDFKASVDGRVSARVNKVFGHHLTGASA